MTSRARVVVELPPDPKLLQDLTQARDDLRKESVKLSKLKELTEIEAELVQRTTQLNSVKTEAKSIIARAEGTAAAIRAQVDLKAQEIVAGAKQSRETYIGEEKTQRTKLETDRQQLLQAKEAVDDLQRGVGVDRQALEYEYSMLHEKTEMLKRRELRLEESLRNLATDVGLLAHREKVVEESEKKIIASFHSLRSREGEIQGKEDTARRAREEAQSELSAAGSRSQEAQEKWNRSQLQEVRCVEREKVLELKERDLEGRLRVLSTREAQVKERENRCLLWDTQLRAQIQAQGESK